MAITRRQDDDDTRHINNTVMVITARCRRQPVVARDALRQQRTLLIIGYVEHIGVVVVSRRAAIATVGHYMAMPRLIRMVRALCHTMLRIATLMAAGVGIGNIVGTIVSSGYHRLRRVAGDGRYEQATRITCHERHVMNMDIALRWLVLSLRHESITSGSAQIIEGAMAYTQVARHEDIFGSIRPSPSSATSLAYRRRRRRRLAYLATLSISPASYRSRADIVVVINYTNNSIDAVTHGYGDIGGTIAASAIRHVVYVVGD